MFALVPNRGSRHKLCPRVKGSCNIQEVQSLNKLKNVKRKISHCYMYLLSVLVRSTGFISKRTKFIRKKFSKINFLFSEPDTRNSPGKMSNVLSSIFRLKFPVSSKARIYMNPSSEFVAGFVHEFHWTRRSGSSCWYARFQHHAENHDFVG